MRRRWNVVGKDRLVRAWRARPGLNRRLLLKVAAMLSVPVLTLTGLFAVPSNASVPPGFQTSLVVGDGLDGPSLIEVRFLQEQVKLVKRSAELG